VTLTLTGTVCFLTDLVIASNGRPVASTDGLNREIGLSVADLSPFEARRLRVPEGGGGVLVSDVEPLGPAYDVEIERGLVILDINPRPVTSAAEYRRLTASAKDRQALAFFVLVLGGQHALRVVRVEGAP
jgi:S1-C subfamily serine protease